MIALSNEEQDRVRNVLKHCETSGADPVIMMARMGLLRSHEQVIKVRQDTLVAIADLFDEMSPSSLPHEASTNPRDMKSYLSQYLRDLARKQVADAPRDQGKKTKKAKASGN